MTRTNLQLNYLVYASDGTPASQYSFDVSSLHLLWSSDNSMQPGRNRKIILVVDYGQPDSTTYSINDINSGKLSFTGEIQQAEKLLGTSAILCATADSTRHASEVWQFTLAPNQTFISNLTVTFTGSVSFCRGVVYELIDSDAFITSDLVSDGSGSSVSNIIASINKYRHNPQFLCGARRSNENGTLTTSGATFNTDFITTSLYSDSVYRVVSGKNPTSPTVTFGNIGDSNAIRGWSWIIGFI